MPHRTAVLAIPPTSHLSAPTTLLHADPPSCGRSAGRLGREGNHQERDAARRASTPRHFGAKHFAAVERPTDDHQSGS